MNNTEIINNVAAAIYGREEVMEMVAQGIEPPVHTALGWKIRGNYRIKDGVVGIDVKLWKKRKRVPGTEEETADEEKDSFYLSKATLYCREQVELVEQ